ncbi:DUF1343 domain-containing protein [Flaviaesturariibacter amylovorans]|uniref:DUF1343 domain-containing protein n=1 Tax=Flaviaesturariibacter amylovorans TaxID=1084520 RepID=A0ABP8GNC3_9BACT
MFARILPAALLLSLFASCAGAQKTKSTEAAPGTSAAGNPAGAQGILPAAERPDQYLPHLKGKRVALLVNQTSTAGGKHLVDVLRAQGVTLQVIFGPEHGFRGNAPDGAKIESSTDPATGVPVVSLYGKKLKPSAEDLKNVDVMVYDIQDVGTRFYTYISSLQYYMEAALENNIPLVVLDRPNPNGHYVDGPVLDRRFASFVGMQPVPVVYGLTAGEYAQMILQEGWLSESANAAYRNLQRARYAAGARFFQLHVVPCANYTHGSVYALPVAPSPNLPTMATIWWYPSTCLFEGTVLSEGRGTPAPFRTMGHPELPKTLYSFTPRATSGAPNPKHKDATCYGWLLPEPSAATVTSTHNRLQLGTLLEAYRLFPQKDSFFKVSTFNRLAGNDVLLQQIREGKSEAEIRASWQPGITAYKAIRKNYLLYPDFE